MSCSYLLVYFLDIIVVLIFIAIFLYIFVSAIGIIVCTAGEVSMHASPRVIELRIKEKRS